ncbi:hypothetical protein [Psychroserpens sp. MEBiC05023]
MSIFKYYKVAVLYPSILVCLSGILFSIVSNRNYISDFISKDAIIELGILFTVLHVLIMLILSLPIMLHQKSVIHNSKLYSIISWFFFPIIYLGIILFEHFSYETNTRFYTNDGTIFILILTVPYIISVMLSYYMYKGNFK